MLIQEDYFKNIFNTVREAILILDENMKVLSANRSFFTIFKVDSANTIGSPLYDLGNGQWNIQYLRVLLEDILPKNDTVDDYEIKHNFESIGQKTMLLNACKIREKKTDQPIILLAIEDITERKRLEDLLEESEKRYRRVFETASDGIVLLEKREGKIINANPATEKMLGYSKEESIGKKLQDIGVSLDMSDFPAIMQALDKSDIINYDDVMVKTKSGPYIYADIYMVDRAKLAQCNIRDVTERKLAEEELIRSEKEYKDLFDSTLDGIYQVDADGVFISMNTAGARIFGYESPEEIIGKNALEHWRDPKDRDVFRVELKVKKMVSAYHMKAKKKTGEPIELESSSRIIEDDKGNFLGIEGILRDVTERKKAEAELRLFKNLINQANDSIFVVDPETGRFLDVNAKACNNLGYDRKELLKMAVFDIDDIAVSDTFEWKTQVHEVKNKGYMVLEGRQRRKDGSTFPVEVNISYISLEKRDYMVAVARDITERKRAEDALRESEEKFRDLFENANDGIFILDLEGNFIDVNRTAYERLGYTKDEMLSMSVKEIDTSEFAPRVPERLAQIQEHGHAMFESAHHRKDGTIVPVEVNSRIMQYRGQKVYFSVIRDITERKKTEEKLNLLFDEVTRAKKEWELTFDSVAETIALIDKEFNIIRCNKSCADFCGMPLNTVPGHKFYDLFPLSPEDLEYFKCKIQKEESTEWIEVKIETGRWFYVCSRPITDKNGAFLYSAIIATDITGLKDAQERIRESEEVLKGRVKELEKFYEMAVGRELRMKELKEEISKLRAELLEYRT